jgi:hypothetical protein
MLTIEAIRAASRRVSVELPEFGVTVQAVGFKGVDRMQILGSQSKADGSVDTRGFMCAVLAATIVDDAGEPWLTPELAGELPDASFQALYFATAKLNGLLGSSVEDAAKNSEAAQSGDSPSA